MNLTWTILTTKGPAVGSKTVASRAEATIALQDAVADAFGGAYGPEHIQSVRRLCNDLRTAELPFTFRAPAITITVEE